MSGSADEVHAKEGDTWSEAEALADILNWSKGCPAWQRDALRRLCSKGELDDADFEELVTLCKVRGVGGVPLGEEHVPDPDSVTTVVNLNSIHSVENVNALKPGERLTFDKTGLTVVYGDNGSGKSGYARILKKVCRARIGPKNGKIRPNIYATKVAPQKAVIDFTADGHKKTYTWVASQPSDPLLSAVSVFDSRTANLHVDELNDVAYTPFPMRLLEQLAEACRHVKEEINSEIRELDEQTPEVIRDPKCRDTTSVGKLIAALNGQTKEQDVRVLATLSDKDKSRLQTLRADLGRDPAKAARQLEALKNRLQVFNSWLGALERAVDDKKVHNLRALYAAYKTAQAAAAAAADDLFRDEPLPDIGSEVWRSLWEAARRYSEQRAYPDALFPFTGDGARCVLCQQKLDGEAAERLNRFEAFVKEETKRKEREAAVAYEAALKEVVDVEVSMGTIADAVAFIRDELDDIELARFVRRAAVTLKWRARAIRRNHIYGPEVTLPAGEAWPADVIAAHGTALSDRIAALLAEGESEARKKMRQEFEDLTDREWLAMVQEDVIAEVGRRRKRAELGAALKATATNRITAKSDDISEGLVTNALRAQFSKEIDKFGVADLAIDLRKMKTRYGVPQFQVRLMRKPDERVGEILSEGEHRCVALAAFLAELATTDSRSAIVFDDPVSSLDHVHREAVAERLAEEARNRQVVILTHDIAFLFLLDQACREKRAHVAFRSVTRTNDYAGFVQQDPPARAQPIEKVIDGMQKQFDNEKRFYETGDHEKWEQTVDALQKRLRWTWERAVEEAVSPVIKRLSNKVETKGLSKVTTLTIDDCMQMRYAYGRCSTLLHSTADALNPPLPTPDVVQNEITLLRKWVEDIKQRQRSIDWLQ